MDKQEEKELEAFVDKIMADAPLESPSADFTKNLMQHIEAVQHKEVYQYRPIVPKQVLVLIFVGLVSLTLYLIAQYGLESDGGWFGNVSVEPVFDNMWGWLENYTSSKILIYAVLLFGLLFFVQVPLIKKQLERNIMLE
ncbi:hypothetical protein [Flagellimonas amoyensis]|uniref:hypothetical protein n=1 Tax=Flagellimonas amoyensis TaxID=2169401 RepID=UPI000D39D06A|nr:hypothetical protein [Allomuricauda amoyensis]